PTKGLKGALLTLLWFWLPAHTVTFLLPEHWQVTLAAVWSFVLGIILGYFSGHSKEENKEEKVEILQRKNGFIKILGVDNGFIGWIKEESFGTN
ncbi:MAG: hypothetical protein IE890_14490, partial [Arcobacter sp.]|nr:hypothetical protein [Arcobacter sp.]